MRSNTLLKKLPLDCQYRLLKACSKVKFEPGELVYYRDQVADKSRQLSLVYLILSGRVSCRLSRNACFKQYVEGSFFGDIECVAGVNRLCAVKAESALCLAAIDKQSFFQILALDAETRLIVERLALQRYLAFKHCIRKAAKFSLLCQNNEFWEEAGPAPLNPKVDALIALLSRDRPLVASDSPK